MVHDTWMPSYADRVVTTGTGSAGTVCCTTSSVGVGPSGVATVSRKVAADPFDVHATSTWQDEPAARVAPQVPRVADAVHPAGTPETVTAPSAIAVLPPLTIVGS